MSYEDKRPEGARLGWLWPYVRPHLASLAAVLGLATLISLLAIAQPYLTKLIIDDGLIGRRFDLLVKLCAAIVSLAALAFLLGGFNRWQYVRVSGRILSALREHVYAHLLKLSPEFFRERAVGDLVARLDGDVAEVQRFSTDTLLASCNAAVLLIATAAIMLAMSWKLTLVAACMIPVQLLVRYAARVHITRTTRALREQSGRLTHFFMETLGAAKAVQAAVAERHEQGRLVDLNREFLGRVLSQQVVSYGVGGVSGLLSHAVTAAVFIVGGYQVLQGSLTVGTLVAFIAYLTRGTGSAVSLLNLYTAYHRALVSLHRVRELLDAEPPAALAGERKGGGEDAPGRLKIAGLRYRRQNAARPLLDDFSLDVAAGSKVVVHGASGAGKSTLVDLLRRFVEPRAGSILLDGHDLSEYELGSLRRLILAIETEPVLFKGSIRANLRYGNFDASDAAVIEAATVAGVSEFVAALPDGYDTELGAGGVGLSAGQRQRVAIVRALLGRPSVLVLDEATSNLDARAVRTLHDLIDRHFSKVTRLIITHAPHTVPRADRVYELRDGQCIPSSREPAHAE